MGSNRITNLEVYSVNNKQAIHLKSNGLTKMVSLAWLSL